MKKITRQFIVTARFERIRTLRPHADRSIEAGREYVDAYVDYVHFAERIATLAAGSAATAHVEHAQ
jgi:hypothetical protein